MNTLHKLTCTLALLLILIVAPAAAQEARTAQLALTGVNVVDVVEETVQPDVTLLIDGSRIAALGDVPVPPNARVIDARGRYVIPGLWDMHVHMTWGNWDISELLVVHGITGARDMWGSLERADALHEAAAAGERVPRVVMAGNLVDGAPYFWPDATIAATPERGRAVVDSLADAGAPFIKVYDALDPEVYDAIMARAAQRGLPVAGHVPWQIRAAHVSESGQRSIEHAQGVLPGCSSEEDSVLAGAEELFQLLAAGDRSAALQTWLGVIERTAETQNDARCRALAERLAANETWVVPTLVALRGNWYRSDSTFRSDPRLKYIPPRMRTSWLPENSFPARFFTPEDWQIGRRLYRRAVEVVGLLNDVGVPLLAGSDSGVPYAFPGSGLHDELELLVEAGLSNAQALKAATLSPARFLGRSAELGTIEAGKLADLVLLNGNPLEDISNVRKVHAVVLDGAFLPRSDLDAMLENAEHRPTSGAQGKR